MARIPEEVINDIRNRARIEDIIAHYIDIIKKGNNYVAYCPFHDDHDPSLHISCDKGIWKCFSCPSEEGSAGDVFKFVMKYTHVDYVTAIKTVADLIGYKFDFGKTNTTTFEETDCHKAMREAVSFTQHELLSSAGVRFKKYLNDRDLDDTVIERFNIGYNPGNDALVHFLGKKGYSEQTIVKANLGRMTANGLRDVFYDRITIPIFDIDSHPIGFTARSIEPNPQSKYINSADTPIFNKSNVVFNLNRAKDAIREKRFAIIAEGPMDVIAFERAGLKNVVCSLGTNITKSQLQMIRKFTKTLLLSFDGDEAGQGAILRCGKMARQEDFNILVFNNPSGDDPDEIIRKQGIEVLRGMVSKPKTWMDFILDYYQRDLDLQNYMGRKEYCEKVLEEIDKLPDALDKDNFLQRLAQISGFNYAILSQGHLNEPIAKKTTAIKAIQASPKSFSNGLEIAQKTIIKQILLSPNAAVLFKNEMSQLPDGQFNTLLQHLFNYYGQNNDMNIAQFCANLDSSLVSLIYEIEEDELIQNCYSEDILHDAIITLKLHQIDRDIDALQKKIAQLSDSIVQAKMAAETVALKREKTSLMRSKSGLQKGKKL